MTERLFIAIVDDDPSVCKALGRLLRTSQMDVETYESGDMFLRTSRKRQPDCLVLDIRMPAMTGPELRQQLLGSGQDIPIIFITAHAEDLVTEQRIRAEGVAILRKPFDNETLLDAIQHAIERRAPQ